MALIVVPLRAVIVSVICVVLATVVIVNVAVVAPSGTITLAGTWATPVRLLVRVTAIPPVGAGPFKVTVPVDETPPLTVLGARTSEDRTGAVTVRVARRTTLR